jgi:RND family efflux transporter MFP subunit
MISLPLGLMSLAFPGCHQKVAPPPQGPPTVVVAQPIPRDVGDSFDFTGRLEAVDNVDVRARVSGYLNKVYFLPGRDVQRGDPLFEIDPRPYQALVDKATAEVAQARAMSELSGVEFKRLQDLVKTGSATEIEFERTAAEKARGDAALLVAKAALESAQIDLDWTKITAPLSGRISRKYVDEGNLVVGGSVGATLLTNIVSVSPIHCYFDVDERSLLIFQQAMREHRMKGYTEGGKVAVQLSLANEDGFPHMGEVDFMENKVDGATGTLRIRAIFPNQNDILRPGLFARVRVPLGEPRHAVLISERAIGLDQAQRYVMAINKDNIAEYRRVSVGVLQDGLREIVSGVTASDWVVIHGLQRVRPGMSVQPQRAPMPVEHEQSGATTRPSNASPVIISTTRPAQG